MWKLWEEPPFILPPGHSALFRKAALHLLEEIDSEGDDWTPIGTAVFDDLSPGQKQAALLTVARGLLDATTKSPRLTAPLAATASIIYRVVEGLAEDEIAAGETTGIRAMLLAAAAEVDFFKDEAGRPEKPTCVDSDDDSDWSVIIEVLEDEILEDRDFGMAGEFLDLPPDQAATLKKTMNIDPDYFTAIVEDPGPERLGAIRRELRQLLGGDGA
jgi:hypothetical protein